MSTAAAPVENTEFVDFWNEILLPKFVAYKHILVGGLTHHSEAIFPRLPVKAGDRVLDVGCGFGDTAIQFAKIVGRDGAGGSVLGVDCCDGFMEYGRKEAAADGITNVSFLEADVQFYLASSKRPRVKALQGWTAAAFGATAGMMTFACYSYGDERQLPIMFHIGMPLIVYLKGTRFSVYLPVHAEHEEQVIPLHTASGI